MTNYDVCQSQGQGLKDMVIMVKFKQETHKKGQVFAKKYNKPTILL